jgi:hypothetical protein
LVINRRTGTGKALEQVQAEKSSGNGREKAQKLGLRRSDRLTKLEASVNLPHQRLRRAKHPAYMSLVHRQAVRALWPKERAGA